MTSWNVRVFGPLLNSTHLTSDLWPSSFHVSATPPWLQLAALEHMIVYPAATLGYQSSTIFVSVSTTNPIPICAMPMDACVNLPPPPVKDIPHCHPKCLATPKTKKGLAKYICSTNTIFWNWLTRFCYIIPNYCFNKNVLLYHCLLILSIIMYKSIINNVLVFNSILLL